MHKLSKGNEEGNIKQIPRKNLSKKEEDALQNLSKRDDIIITKADKGGAVVIVDVDDYIQEANRQLDNKEFYKKLTIDTTEISRIKVNRTINELKSSHLLNEKIANDLLSSEAKTPQFKMLPKVHKEGNPGRPVVSSIDCHTTKISKYIDNQLQPHVKELKSYVKDSTDFIRKINSMEKIPDNSILVTMDVRSLYTNIPNKEGIEAVETTLKRKNIGTTIISTFLRLVLTLNNFVFNNQNYLQIKGCAMGTKCAPSYANIFMGMFEERYIYPLIEKISNFYLRFIDDIFLIWTGTTDQLMKFKQQINEVHPSIKFDFNFSNKEINFSDTVVYKTQSGKLETKLYRKESDRQAYLHRKSEHPESLKRSIPFSQALRLRRICSTNNEFQDSCDKLRNKLIERGYKQQEINEGIERTKTLDRKKLLEEKAKKQSNRIPLVLTYNRTLPNVKRAISNNWNLLHINQEFKDVFQEPPILAFRRNRNLYDLLGCKNIVDGKLQRLPKKKKIGFSTKCFSKSGNLCCKQVVHTQSFKSNVTQKTYHIFHELNCKSKLLIYLMECRICRIQYIGKSETEFNIRLNNHRKDVNRQNAPRADQHFKLPDHNFNQHARFILIEQLDNMRIDKDLATLRLKKREDFWIETLKTLHPYGLNAELNFPNQ